LYRLRFYMFVSLIRKSNVLSNETLNLKEEIKNVTYIVTNRLLHNTIYGYIEIRLRI